MAVREGKNKQSWTPQFGGIQDVGVNAAFLSDIKDAEREVPQLLRTVKEMLRAETLGESEAKAVLTILRRLYQRLKTRFQLEDAVGYMEDVVAVAPRLCGKSRRLQREHQSLIRQLQNVVEIAHQHFRKDKLSPNRVRLVEEVFDEFHERFLAHEAEETDLIIEALYLDLGGHG